MKVVSLIGSRRKNGNTAGIVSLIEEKLREIAKERGEVIEIASFDMSNVNVQICRGCRVCFNAGEEKCPCHDDLLQIRERMRNADVIIAASPVYVEDVSGVMKNFIDRLAFVCHRPAFAGKIVQIMTTSGLGSSNHSVKTLKRAFGSWGASYIKCTKFRMGARMEPGDIKRNYNARITKTAESICKAVQRGNARKPSFLSILYFTVQQKYWRKRAATEDTKDAKYWMDMGWLQKGCTYYTEHEASAFTVIPARLLGRLISVFFA